MPLFEHSGLKRNVIYITFFYILTESRNFIISNSVLDYVKTVF